MFLSTCDRILKMVLIGFVQSINLYWCLDNKLKRWTAEKNYWASMVFRVRWETSRIQMIGWLFLSSPPPKRGCFYIRNSVIRNAIYNSEKCYLKSRNVNFFIYFLRDLQVNPTTKLRKASLLSWKTLQSVKLQQKQAFQVLLLIKRGKKGICIKLLCSYISYFWRKLLTY